MQTSRKFERNLERKESDNTIYSSLTEVILAQNYQDLTGQMIKKIITLLIAIEDNLVKLIQNYGEDQNSIQSQVQEASTTGSSAPPNTKEEAPETRGPQSPEDKKGQSQADIDDLLASYGF